MEDTAKLQGATVTKITYIVPEGVYEYTFDGTYIKPKYAAELNLSAAFNSDRTTVTLSGVPAELKDITVSVYYKEGRQTVYAAQNAALENGSVVLSEAADPSKTYTVLLSSSNYADLSATISAVMTDEQKAKLNELIAAGMALVEADSSLATLKAHIDEARALLENADATSAQAEELIAELTELIAEAKPGKQDGKWGSGGSDFWLHSKGQCFLRHRDRKNPVCVRQRHRSRDKQYVLAECDRAVCEADR